MPVDHHARTMLTQHDTNRPGRAAPRFRAIRPGSGQHLLRRMPIIFASVSTIAVAMFTALYATLWRAPARSAGADEVGIIQVIYAQPIPTLALRTVPMPAGESGAAQLAGSQPRTEWMGAVARARVGLLQPTLPTPTPSPTPLPATSIAPVAQADPQPLPIALCPEPVGQVVTETIDGNVTVLPITVHVYLPPCYDPEHYTYPTLYLIHGTAFEQGGWLYDGVPRVADVQMSIGVLPPFIIVMPGADMRAGKASKYSWTNQGKGSYEDFVVNELMPYIDAKYSTWASREGRAIGGISRGGYWAVEIAFAHPDLFSAVGGHSPSVFSKLVGVPANFSMLDLARSVDDLHTLRIWLDAGSSDWARFDMNKLAGDLDKAGVPYQLDIGEGGHEDSYWTSRVPDYLAFYSSAWPRAAHAKQPIGAAAKP